METIKSFAQKLKEEKKVAIFSHVRPDGDTIGSAFALKMALEKLGILADLFCDEEISEKFNFILLGETFKKTLTDSYTAFIAVDSADITRLGNFAEHFSYHKRTYNLDHHISNTRYAKYNLVIDNASNSENVYDLILELGVQIDEKIAKALALGITTDTGAFKHKNLTSKTLEVASKLKDLGADYNAIIYNTFTKQSKQRAKLFALVMSKIRYLLDDRFAVITVLLDDIQKVGAKSDDTEGFIDFIMGIDCVEVGACLLEMTKNNYKISFRSKSADVNSVASVFGGGGHVLASGCRISGDLEEVIDKIRYAVKQRLVD